MSCCSLLDLMWSLNPIELQGIVVRPSLPHSPTPPPNPHHPPSGAFVLPGPLTSPHHHHHHHLLPPLLFSSSSTPPKQNFFKCLIFPPLASFLQAPSHLFVHRFFIPLQPLPPLRLLPILLLLLLLSLSLPLAFSPSSSSASPRSARLPPHPHPSHPYPPARLCC